MEKRRLAVLDMYEGHPNQGMRCIEDILSRFERELNCEVFDVRSKAELPDLSFDMFISTGGPGDPRVGDGVWDKKYNEWLGSVVEWNKNHAEEKKHVFFICHSFQMAVSFFEVATITPRKSYSFGTFPVHLTEQGTQEEIFQQLKTPFWAADFRQYQVVEPDTDRINNLNAEILALEKIRPHIELERAIMAMRFTPEMIGVQFHPEADPDGMMTHFLQPDRKENVIAEYGEEKYQQMLSDLRNPDRILHTYNAILPAFLEQSLAKLQLLETVV